MATQKIDDHIGEGIITIDNIGSFAAISENAVNSIETNDIKAFETNINNLSKVYNKQIRVISEQEPIGPSKGSVWFILQSVGNQQPQTEQISE